MKELVTVNKSLLLLGLLLIIIGVWFQTLATKSYSFSGDVKPYEARSVRKIEPVKIEIPKINIDLPVKRAYIKNGEWELKDRAVSHLATSGYLDEIGNIILYGHNTKEGLMSLENIKLEDFIYLMDDSGNKYIYKVYSISVVNPDQIDKLLSFKQETLSIYTCTGFADLKRLLVKAERIR